MPSIPENPIFDINLCACGSSARGHFLYIGTGVYDGATFICWAFLLWRKSTFSANFFTRKSRPISDHIFFENHISETKRRRDQAAVVSGSYMPKESTPGVSAELEGSLGYFPKILIRGI